PPGPAVRLRRREVLQGLAATAGAGLALPALADEHPMRQHLADPARVAAAQGRAAAGAPAFLDAHQLETLASLAQRVVPGATTAVVAPFIARLRAGDSRENQLRFLEARGWLEGDAIARYGHPWTRLSETQQVELLTAASTAEPARKPHFWVRGEPVL